METYLNWKSVCRSSKRFVHSPCIILCCSFDSMWGITLAIVVISVVMLGPLAAVWILYGCSSVAKRVASPILLWEVLSVVLYWVALGRPMAIVACTHYCWFMPVCQPRARGPKLAGSWDRKSKGRKSLVEWFKMLLQAWFQRENVWSYRCWLGCEKPALLSGAACLLMEDCWLRDWPHLRQCSDAGQLLLALKGLCHWLNWSLVPLWLLSSWP